MKTSKFLTASAIILLLISSCKKNNTPAAVQETKLSKIDYGSNGTTTYTYNANKQMAAETYSGTASATGRVTTYSYDTQGRLSEFSVHYTTGGGDYKSAFIYNNASKIEKINNYNLPSNALTSYSTVEYTAGKYSINRYDNTNVLYSSNETTLTADGSNWAAQKVYNAAGVLQSTSTLGNYDDKTGLSSFYPYGYFLVPANKNNNRAYTLVIASSGTTTSYTYTYEYNADGYPAKLTSSAGSVQAYEYIKL